MSNLLAQAIDCDDADRAAAIIRDALGIESDDVVKYCFPTTWPADRERLVTSASGSRPRLAISRRDRTPTLRAGGKARVGDLERPLETAGGGFRRSPFDKSSPALPDPDTGPPRPQAEIVGSFAVKTGHRCELRRAILWPRDRRPPLPAAL